MINKKNLLNKKAGITYLEILILMISIFAFSYLIYHSVKIVKAAELTPADLIPPQVCCEETTKGLICQDRPEAECNITSPLRMSTTSCEETSYCKTGCCISSKTGLCSESTPQRLCSNEKDTWYEGEMCSLVNECQKGCCVLNGWNEFTTESNCKMKSGSQGINTNFYSSIDNELECIFLTKGSEKGACIDSEDKTKCRYITRDECKDNKNFYKDVYCSDPILNTNCKAKNHTGCLEGDSYFNVYWFDSCNNPESVYQECNILRGTMCGEYRPGLDQKPSIGNSVCMNISFCKTKSGTYQNGESWCEYEGTIGEGKDIPGSSHFLHMCIYGKEEIDLCDSKRQAICVQQDSKLDNGVVFSNAGCVVNGWRDCLGYNTINDTNEATKKCSENIDCFVKEVNIDSDFQFNYCAPKYPPGFDLKVDGEDAKTLCSAASVSCTYIRQRDWKGNWKDVSNSNCKSEEFTQKMNDLCMSLGDCGAKVNIAGKISKEGYAVSGAPGLSSSYLDILKKYSTKNINQKPAEVGNRSSFGPIGNPEGLGTVKGENESTEAMDVFSKISGGLGVAAMAISAGVYIGSQIGTSVTGTITYTELAAMFESGASTSATIASFGYAASSAAACLGAAVLAIQIFGLKGDAAKIMLIVGGVMALAIGIASVIWNLGPYGMLAAVVVLIIGYFLDKSGIGEIDEEVITFSCNPWKPPAVDNNAQCEKCNEDKNKLCTAYRCHALGRTCELINEGTGEDACVYMKPQSVSAPKIKPLEEVLSSGYKYTNITENGFEIKKENGDCIDAFTNVVFGIKTDQYSECKMSMNLKDDFDSMNINFNDGGLDLINHTVAINIPSQDSLASKFNLTSEQIQKLGEVNFYVRCYGINEIKNPVSYVVRTCVNPGPDRTPPVINPNAWKPSQNSYLKYNETEMNLDFYVNEPANCRWSNLDQSYDKMENNISCEKNILKQKIFGFYCTTKLTGISKNSKFYFKCQDISENKNNMSESIEYSVIPSVEKLEMKIVNPKDGEIIITENLPFTETFKLETTGGAEEGKAKCEYNINQYSDEFSYPEGYSNTHVIKLPFYTKGIFNTTFTCIDSADNIDTKEVSFTIRVDDTAPVITRIYNKEGLTIITDETAECKYSFDRESNFENMIGMNDNGVIHSVSWNLKNYYIQCKDKFGNIGNKIEIKGVLIN
jgi:hypothetical protein